MIMNIIDRAKAEFKTAYSMARAVAEFNPEDAAFRLPWKGVLANTKMQDCINKVLLERQAQDPLLRSNAYLVMLQSKHRRPAR